LVRLKEPRDREARAPSGQAVSEHRKETGQPKQEAIGGQPGKTT
jgi:hypothetical protein